MGFTLDWSVLGRAPDVGDMFRKGMDQGRDTIKSYAQDNALAALARNPDDVQALQMLGGINPEAAWKFGDRRASQEKAKRDEASAQLEARRDDIIKGAQLVRQMKPADQAGWDAVLSTAEQLGINLEGVSRQFDPQYVQGLVAAADAFEPLKSSDSDLQFLTPQDGGVYVGNKRSGDVKPAIIPNPGDKTVGDTVPLSHGRPKVTDQASYDAVPAGQEYTDPSGHVRVKPGGQASPAPGTFPETNYGDYGRRR